MSTTNLSTQTADTSIVQVAAGLAVEAVKHADIIAAQDAAKYALSIVVTDADSLRDATECGLKVARGQKALRAAKKPLSDLLARLREAFSVPFAEAGNPLDEAEKYLDTQALAYNARVAAEAERARRAAEAERMQAERAAREAEAAGKPAPPPPVRRFVEPPPPITRTTGGSQSVTYTLKCELANPHECDPSFLELRAGVLEHVRRWVKDGDVSVPQTPEPTRVQYRGLSIWYEPGIMKRTS